MIVHETGKQEERLDAVLAELDSELVFRIGIRDEKVDNRRRVLIKQERISSQIACPENHFPN